MNQYEFYSNFFKYRGKKEDLQHSSKYGDYYHKIENYYGPGKSRYFDTKDEYDAYLREQEKQYNKTKEELAQKNVNKFTSGRDAAIKNSQNPAVVSAQNKANDLKESDKRIQGSSSNNATGYGNEYQKYLNKGYSDTLPGAQRAKKEKENAEKAAERSKLLNTAQSGREAAINNSYKMSDEEIQEAFDKDKKWQEEQKKLKNPVYAAMKNIQKRINRLENLQNQQSGRQAAINNSEKISDEEWKKRLEADKQYQQIAKMPGGKVIADSIVKKKTALNNPESTETETTSIKNAYNTVKDLTSEYAAKSNADKQVKLDELNNNFKEFRTILQKLKRGNNTLTRKQIEDFKKTNPLYQALNESFADGDSEYDLLDYIDVGGKKGDMRIDYAEESLKELVSALEDTINNGTVKTTSKEQPKPGRGAI